MSYLNTKPLIYAFENGRMQDEIELVSDYPANIATALLNNEIDIGLIPVAVIPLLKQHYIISDYGIAASNAVASVCLFSDVPLAEITHVLVDYQSRTSAELLKILLKHHWRISPVLIDTENGYQLAIKGTTAGLVIGDRALRQRKHSKYIYDLALAWQEMTSLPFLFAAWVANKKLPDIFIKNFNEATAEGLQHIAEIVKAHPFADYDLETYYTNNIDYNLNAGKQEALKLFLQYLSIQENVKQ